MQKDSSAWPLFGGFQQRSVHVLSLLDEPEARQDLLRGYIERIHHRLNGFPRIAWTFFPTIPLDKLPGGLLFGQERVLVLPWSLSQPFTQRRDARQILSQVVEGPLGTCEKKGYVQPPLTACLPISRLGEWSAHADALKRLVTLYPGWDTELTICSQAKQRIVVVRALEKTGFQESFTMREPVMPERDQLLYHAYLARLLIAACRACWPDEDQKEEGKR